MTNRFIKYPHRILAALQGSQWRLLLTLLLCIGGMACTQERQPCLTPKIASLRLRFVHFTSDSLAAAHITSDTGLPKAIFVAVTGGGNKGLIATAPTTTFTISLSSVTDSCQWLFQADTTVTDPDMLTFYYQRKLQFLSNACGYAYFYSLDSVHNTQNNVDSVKITNSGVTNDVNTTHLSIFFKRNY